jgi:hypothetical protein
MTPQEKAEELKYKYMSVRWDIGPDDAKNCALIAVNEILDYIQEEDNWYWQDVKHEIEKL